jgi:hypothetical protein
MRWEGHIVRIGGVFWSVNRTEGATVDAEIIARWFLDMWSVSLCLCGAEWIEVA